jgi:hypothetical protein
VAERAIGAPATQVYRLIADFDRHHPRFLPSALTGFRVEEGGVDAGDRAQLPDERWRAGPRFPHAGRGAGPWAVLTESDQGFLDDDNLGRYSGGTGLPGPGGDSLCGLPPSRAQAASHPTAVWCCREQRGYRG